MLRSNFEASSTSPQSAAHGTFLFCSSVKSTMVCAFHAHGNKKNVAKMLFWRPSTWSSFTSTLRSVLPGAVEVLPRCIEIRTKYRISFYSRFAERCVHSAEVQVQVKDQIRYAEAIPSYGERVSQVLPDERRRQISTTWLPITRKSNSQSIIPLQPLP
jgi:hypothetical protein